MVNDDCAIFFVENLFSTLKYIEKIVKNVSHFQQPGGWLWLAGQAVGCGWLLGGDTVHSTLTRHTSTSTLLFTFPYHNSTRTHLLTHPSSGLEPGPYSDRTTPKIPAAQLYTSSHPPQHISKLTLPSHIHPSSTASSAPCGDPPSALWGRSPSSCGLSKTPPLAPPRVEGGGRRPRGVGYCWVPFGGLAP